MCRRYRELVPFLSGEINALPTFNTIRFHLWFFIYPQLFDVTTLTVMTESNVMVLIIIFL